MDELLIAQVQGEVRRLLRFRIPLLLAIAVNFALLVRIPLAQMGAEAAPQQAAETTVLAVAEPTLPSQAPPPCPPIHTASQEIAHRPAESAAPSPTAASTGGSRSALASACERAIQRLVAHRFAPARPTNPGNSGPTPESVPVPDMTTAAEPPALHHPDVSPPAQRVDASPTGLAIENASENEEPVSFLVDGRLCVLQPGEAHEFAAGTSWILQFHRGGSFGNLQQTLVPGVYRFVVTDQGWDLKATR